AGPVVPDRLDDASVARRSCVGDHDAVGGLLLLAHTHETDLDGHEIPFGGTEPPRLPAPPHPVPTPRVATGEIERDDAVSAWDRPGPRGPRDRRGRRGRGRAAGR